MPGSAAPGSTRQRVLVTGGASGIGRAMAEAFIATGARVHVADLVGEPGSYQRVKERQGALAIIRFENGGVGSSR